MSDLPLGAGPPRRGPRAASADGIVLSRARRLRDLVAIPGAPVGERVKMFASACRKCGGKKRVEVTSTRKRRGWKCANGRCKTPWRTWYAYGAGGSSSRRAQPGNVGALDRFVDDGLMLRGLTRWERRVLEVYANTVGMRGRRTQTTLEVCSEFWPRRRGGWSRWIVRELLDAARRKVDQRLARKGIFD